MKKIALFVVCSAFSLSATAIDRLTVDALNKGQSSGPVLGAMAEKINAKTHSQNPITMSVRVMHRYVQPGCARLDYIVIQPEVKTKDGSLQELKMQWQMNICEDGQPPAQPMTILPQ